VEKPNSFLVGAFNPSEKYESQLGLLFPIYGKIKFMFQTTNQFYMGKMVFTDVLKRVSSIR